LSTTAFQAGMLTPVDLKTLASLATYYPRDVVFFALIAAIDVKFSGRYARLINDPSAAYYDINVPLGDLDQTRCSELFEHPGPQVFFGPSQAADCSYEKFANLLSLLIHNGLYTELVQIPAPQPAQAQANQSNIVTFGQLCLNKSYVPQQLLKIQGWSLLPCGRGRKVPTGGTVQVTTTQTDKFDDRVVNIDTKSKTEQTVTTTNSVLPITGKNFRIGFIGIGEVEIEFELRSPNGFLSYLGSWYKVGHKVSFLSEYYHSVSAQTIFNGGPYLAIQEPQYITH
jgi:hypothetical protein